MPPPPLNAKPDKHLHIHLDGITITIQQDPAILALLTDLQTRLERIETKMSVLDDKIATLTQDVTDENTVIDSAMTLIGGIPKMISDAVAAALAAGATPTQLQGLTDLAASIEAKKAALAAAVVAGTPAAPTP